MQSETFLLHPGISVEVSEMPRRRSEEDEQRWQRDRTEEARGTSAREPGVLVLLAEMVRKN